MVRLARAVSGAALLSLALAGCDTCPELSDFALIDPAGTAELIPGGPGVLLTWSPIASSSEARFTLVQVDLRQEAGSAELREGRYTMREDPAAPRIRPAVYNIQVEFLCDLDQHPYEASQVQLIYRQGVSFLDDELAFDGGQQQREIVVTTVSRSTMDLELIVDPTPDDPLGADARVFSRASIPGELIAFLRRYDFTGQDIDGAALPDGTYRVYGRVHAASGAITYDTVGPILTWRQ